jgi:16S rRNA processing protein RimM
VVTHVEQVWFHDGRPVFKFAGIDSISAAEPWEGSDLLIPQSQRLTLEEGEYTHADLIGCAVQQDARVVGVVKGIAEYGGPVVLEIQAQDGREILVPFAREICREIDVANKRILVQLPEGLSDL